MDSSWRVFVYVMGANFQVLLLFVGAHELSVFCKEGGRGWLCSYEPYFLLVALFASVLVFYRVFSFILALERRRREEE